MPNCDAIKWNSSYQIELASRPIPIHSRKNLKDFGPKSQKFCAKSLKNTLFWDRQNLRTFCPNGNFRQTPKNFENSFSNCD